MSLSDKVKQLEQSHYEAMTLLGNICITLTLPRNVMELEKEPAGKVVVNMAKEWLDKFSRLEASR